ncbi:hypothetical protein DH2020_016707 [Rehmannia glutinosa]|uniref:Protein kinase domain-containing protein n=1 Tax=Rehmannia glutinosa TaxID=99300 RepID=A0ABR0WP18_REHGL
MLTHLKILALKGLMETENGDSKSKMEDYSVIENLGREAADISRHLVYCHEKSSDILRYVLKKIRLSKQTEKLKSKACQEMNLIAKLCHPYILEYKDAWVDKGSCICIVTNYCEVGNISEIMRKARGAYFPEEKICKWLTQLLLAIDYLHSNRVLHRDLKLSNIFVTKENDIRLGDFGLAKLLNDEGLASSVVGTPSYMCPEILANMPYCYKSDIWSLGCCMFEIAARQQAFRAPAAELLRHPHLQPFLLRCQNPSTVFLPVTSPSPNNTKEKTRKSSPSSSGGGNESKNYRERYIKLKQRDLLPLFEENNDTQYQNLLDGDVSIEDELETKRVDPTSYSGKISIDSEDSKSGATSETTACNGDNRDNYDVSSLKESFCTMDASTLPSNSLDRITKSENADRDSEKSVDAELLGGPQVTAETKLEADDNTLQTMHDTVCSDNVENCPKYDTVKVKEDISIDLTETEKEETELVNRELIVNHLLKAEAAVCSDKSKGQTDADALESLLELCARLLKQDKFDELSGVLKPFGEDAVSSRETAIWLTKSLMNARKLAKES